MSRPLRIQYPNAHYHVCARGNERRRVFWEKRDYERFCYLLEESCQRFELRLFAFVLMTNHFHLMLSLWDKIRTHFTQEFYNVAAQPAPTEKP